MAKRILFQGDSITDCDRRRSDFYHLGFGYPNLIKASLGMDCPGEYEFVNRGVSGDRIVDLYARIKADFINLKPDYASIYIGVNDTWHEINDQNGVYTEKFEKIYTMLIEEIQAACPETKLILITPYVLEGPGSCNTEEKPDKYNTFRADVAQKSAAAKRIAEKFGLALVELQPAFDEACAKAPASYWTGDGVHPSECGHEIIKRLWLDAFEKIK